MHWWRGAAWEYTADGPGCPHRADRNIVDGFVHDLRCWGWRTALWNVGFRLTQ